MLYFKPQPQLNVKKMSFANIKISKFENFRFFLLLGLHIVSKKDHISQCKLSFFSLSISCSFLPPFFFFYILPLPSPEVAHVSWNQGCHCFLKSKLQMSRDSTDSKCNNDKCNDKRGDRCSDNRNTSNNRRGSSNNQVLLVLCSK